MALPPSGSARFDEFEVDLCAHELRRSGERVRLQEKPFQLLTALLEHPGEAVSRETLRLALWPSDTHVEFDDSLNHIVRRLREALGDTSAEPQYIETVPRYGYRFIGRIEPSAFAATSAGALQAPPGPASDPTLPLDAATADSVAVPARARTASPTWWRAGAFAALLAGVGVLVALGLQWRQLPVDSAAGEHRIRSVAVLPFENLSRDPEGDLLARGLTDALTTALARLESVRVISRASVVAYLAEPRDARAIGRDLQVDTIVEGTVLRSGDRLRVTAQLVHTRDDRHIWAHRYDRDVREVVALEQELAAAIANPLDAVFRFAAAAGNAKPLDPEAYLAYQRGRFLMETPTPTGLQDAVGQFRKATDVEPEYAQAHAWMARAHVRLAKANQLSSGEAFAEAERAATRALELDPALPEALVALASKRFLYDWRWGEAERLFASALPVVAADAEAHALHADFLSAMGRFDEAIAEAYETTRIDPVSTGPRAVPAYHMHFARRYDQAIAQARSVLEVDSQNALAILVIGFASLGQGDTRSGREGIEAFIRLAQSPAWSGLLGYARAVEGDRDGALAVLKELESLSRSSYVSPVQFAIVHGGLGERDTAFAWLDKAYAARDQALPFLRVWPMVDPLRGDPRFDALLRRIGLP